MTTDEIKAELTKCADTMVTISGYLMYVATSNGRCANEPEEHDEGCTCQLCRVFLASQDVGNRLAAIVKEM